MMRLLNLCSVCLLVIVLCSGCQSAPTVAELSSYTDVDRNITLCLGMTQTEVESLLGPGTFFDWDLLLNKPDTAQGTSSINESRAQKKLADYTYGSEESYLFLTYQEGSLLGISVSPPDMATPWEGSSWQDGHALRYGASYEDILAQCGTPSRTLEDLQVGSYCFTLLSYDYDTSGNLLDSEEGATLLLEYFVEQEQGTLLAYSVAQIIAQ